jgi:hypothetical protein
MDIKYIEQEDANEEARNMKISKIELGGVWEYNWWEIYHNYRVTDTYHMKPCKHCFDFATIKCQSFDGTKYEEESWVCPRVVVAYNEGGHNTTGVCMDCIAEEFKNLN